VAGAHPEKAAGGQDVSQDLTIGRAGPLTELTLARPAKANALSAELVEALLAAVTTAAGDGTRLLVLRGEGKNFCAGFDFSDLETSSDGDVLRRLARIEILLQALYHAPMATLALAQGGTYGAGADLVACCDRRIAAPDTVFRMPGLRFGVALGTRRLAARVGADRALEIQASARSFDAAEAANIGFINAIAPAEGWGKIVNDMLARQKLDARAHAALKARVQVDSRDADMAALIHLASVPGLKDRIKAFRAARD
jgi:enoyl-CoA hydratase/carnithine racemase